MTRRMKLVVAYLGGEFHGWQLQAGQRTVQGELERALRAFTDGRRVPIVGAGRTDGGVHAAAQVAHADLPTAIPPEGLVRGLNHLLPPEIRIRSARPVGPGFHARRSALGKLYTYRARWREASLPWLQPRSATVVPVGREDALFSAARLLPGRHDWASFTPPGSGRGSTVRRLYGVRLHRRREGLDIDFVGEGFLRYQVRRLVGALLEVGWEQRRVSEFQALIEDPTPGAPVLTAPAPGLTLERVYYRHSPRLSLE